MGRKSEFVMEAHYRPEVKHCKTPDEFPDRVVDSRKGGTDAAISEAEESLHRAVVSYGPRSEQTREIATRLVLAYNHLAMKRLSEHDIKGSFSLLKRAKLLTGGDQPFLGGARLQARALTLNNLGCLMKKWGKPREGVRLLARALRIEAEIPGTVDNPAGTHVNMSAALSTLGFHRAAAAHAGHAIDLALQALPAQQEQASFTTAEEDFLTTGVDSVEVAGRKVAEVAGEASAVYPGVDFGQGIDHTSGGGDVDPSTSVGGQALGGGSNDETPPSAAGEDGETIASAAADDGRSPETSSVPPPAADVARGTPANEEEAAVIKDPELSVLHQDIFKAGAGRNPAEGARSAHDGHSNDICSVPPSSANASHGAARKDETVANSIPDDSQRHAGNPGGSANRSAVENTSGAEEDGRSPVNLVFVRQAEDVDRYTSKEEKASGKSPSEGSWCQQASSPGGTSSSRVEEGSSGWSSQREPQSSAAGGLLAIAFFNLGVEREHLGQLEAALSSYEDARLMADRYLSLDSPIVRAIEEALDKACTAAVAAASYSSRRAAWRERTAVSSFPSIGKLQFGCKTPDRISSVGGGGRQSPRRWRGQQQPGGGGCKTASNARTRDLLDRAYASPRPCRAPPHKDSRTRPGQMSSSCPRSPPGTPRPEQRLCGPQRAGRWTTKAGAPMVRLDEFRDRPGDDERPSMRSVDDDLRWRALVCAEFKCSPREALRAQRTTHRESGVGALSAG